MSISKRVLLVILVLIGSFAAISDRVFSDITVGNIRSNTVTTGLSKVSLPDNVATGFVRFSVPTDTNQGGCIRYGIHADDGTDFLSLNGMLTFSAVNIAGTESCDVQEVANNQSEVSPGGGDSLAVSFTCVSAAADTIDILVTSNFAGIVATTHEIYFHITTNKPMTVTGL